jgi:hypothetical protein
MTKIAIGRGAVTARACDRFLTGQDFRGILAASDSDARVGFVQAVETRHMRERVAKPGSGLFADLPSSPAKA